MLKTVYAIAVAAIAAACLVAFPSLSPQVEARSPGAKADRADLRPLGAECSQKAWPYFEGACLRDSKKPLAPPRDVRIVTADRTTAITTR